MKIFKLILTIGLIVGLGSDIFGAWTNASRSWVNMIAVPKALSNASKNYMQSAQSNNYLRTSFSNWWTTNRVLTKSCGVFTAPVFTNKGNGVFSMSAGSYNLYDRSDLTGTLRQFYTAGLTNYQLNSNTFYYVYAEYVSPTNAIIKINTIYLANGSSSCIIATLFWEKINEINDLNIYEYGNYAREPAAQILSRLIRCESYTRGSGLIISDVTNRTFQITSGQIYFGHSLTLISNVNTAIRKGQVHTYYKSNSEWKATTNNYYYNNYYFQGATNYGIIATNSFALTWVYIGVYAGTPKVFLLYGNSYSNTLETAMNETPPHNVPTILNPSKPSFLIGRIISAKNTNSANIILSQFDAEQVVVGGSSGGGGGGGVSTHNDLGGLDGGAPGEYYHLSLNKYQEVLTLSNNFLAKISSVTQTFAKASQTNNFVKTINWNPANTNNFFKLSQTNSITNIILRSPATNTIKSMATNNIPRTNNIGQRITDSTNILHGTIGKEGTNRNIVTRTYLSNMVRSVSNNIFADYNARVSDISTSTNNHGGILTKIINSNQNRIAQIGSASNSVFTTLNTRLNNSNQNRISQIGSVSNALNTRINNSNQNRIAHINNTSNILIIAASNAARTISANVSTNLCYTIMTIKELEAGRFYYNPLNTNIAPLDVFTNINAGAQYAHSFDDTLEEHISFEFITPEDAKTNDQITFTVWGFPRSVPSVATNTNIKLIIYLSPIDALSNITRNGTNFGPGMNWKKGFTAYSNIRGVSRFYNATLGAGCIRKYEFTYSVGQLKLNSGYKVRARLTRGVTARKLVGDFELTNLYIWIRKKKL